MTNLTPEKTEETPSPECVICGVVAKYDVEVSLTVKDDTMPVDPFPCCKECAPKVYDLLVHASHVFRCSFNFGRTHI